MDSLGVDAALCAWYSCMGWSFVWCRAWEALFGLLYMDTN